MDQDNLVSDQDNLVSDQENEELYEENIINFCTQPKSMKELMEHFNYKHRTYFVNTYIKPLFASNKLDLTIPDKPNSRKQKYIKK